MKTNDTCDMLRRGGSCYLSDLRLLKLRSQTHHWKLEGGDLKTKHTHTHTHTQKKNLKYYIYQRPWNLRTGAKN